MLLGLKKTVANEVGKEKKSSYAVFMRHYARAGASGMVSTPCYEEWKETRKEPAKKPEESFRRSITAHICKSSGRRPFPPAVESELLDFIRRKEPWPMARDLGLNIGTNGFRAKGYYESLQEGKSSTQCEEEDEMDGEEYLTNNPSEMKDLKQYTSQGSFQSYQTDDVAVCDEGSYDGTCAWSRSSSTEDENSLNEVMHFDSFNSSPSSSTSASTTSNPLEVYHKPPAVTVAAQKQLLIGPMCTSPRGQARKRKRVRAEEALQAWTTNRGLMGHLASKAEITELELTDGISTRAKFIRSFMQAFTPEQYKTFCFQNEMDPISPISLYMVDNSLERRFMLETLSRDFLCPEDQSSISFQQLPCSRSALGKFRFNVLQSKYVETDPVFKSIVGGDCTGNQVLSIQPSKLHFLLTIHWATPVMQSKGEVWTHMRFRNLQTKAWHVLRACWRPDPACKFLLEVTVQDVTNLFSQLVIDEQPSLY